MPKDCVYFASWGKSTAGTILPSTIVFGESQNSSSSSFALWGKIKIHDFTLTDQDWIGLVIFKNFADQDWIGCNFIGSGLDLDWKISQSAHLWYIGLPETDVLASSDSVNHPSTVFFDIIILLDSLLLLHRWLD